MRETGIIRRIDDLGRIVIPKEVRRRVRIEEGDPLEIFFTDDEVIFRRYDSAKTIAGALRELNGIVTDSIELECRDTMLAKIKELTTLLKSERE